MARTYVMRAKASDTSIVYVWQAAAADFAAAGYAGVGGTGTALNVFVESYYDDTGGGGGVTAHSALTGLTTGDDHPQYLRTDGTHALTGAQSFGGFKATNVATPTAGGDGVNKTYCDAGAATALASALAADPIPGGAPVNVTKAAASAGAATTWSRSDHKHDVSTAVVGAVALSNTAAAEGVATTLARSDHTHSLAAGTGGGQQPFYDGAAWHLLGLLTGTALADSNATLAIAGGCQYILPVATALTADRTITLSITGASKGLIFTIFRLNTSAFVLNINDPFGLVFTFPASASWPITASFRVNNAGTGFDLAGWAPMAPVV